MAKTLVFLSWSGKASSDAAAVLRDYLPAIIQAVQPFYSPKDIEKGAQWWGALSAKLESAPKKVGIVFLTRSNLESRWMNFEAGAIAASPNSRVCTVLLGVTQGDIGFPLGAFQHTTVARDEFLQLLQTINALTDEPIEDSTLDRLLGKFWPDLEGKLQAIVKAAEREAPMAAKAAQPVPFEKGLADQLVRIENALALISGRLPPLFLRAADIVVEPKAPSRGMLFSDVAQAQSFLAGLDEQLKTVEKFKDQLGTTEKFKDGLAAVDRAIQKIDPDKKK